MRLRNLIVLTVIVPLFLVLVIFSLVAIKSLEDNVRSKLQTEVQIITNAIGTSLGYALDRGSPEALQDSLHSAFSFHRIYGAYVFDTEGREIYGLGLGEALFAPEDMRAVVEAGELVGDYRQHDGWTYYVEKEWWVLDELVASARELVEEALDRHAIRLELDLPEPPLRLLVNGQQLIQVFTNLLRNATQADAVRLIRLTARHQGDELRLWLEDDEPCTMTTQESPA